MLSEIDNLKAENLKLRVQVLELQKILAQMQLNEQHTKIETDRQILEAAFKTVLEAKDGEVFDWKTLTFNSPAEAK